MKINTKGERNYGSISLGYQLAADSAEFPADIKLCTKKVILPEEAYMVSLNIHSDWQTGVTGEIVLQNTGENEFYFWELAFDTNVCINRRKKTMNQDKKKRLLLVPMIFVVILYVPVMGLAIVPKAYLLGGGMVLWNPCVFILCRSMLIWCALFGYTPIGVYIAMLAVYTVVS